MPFVEAVLREEYDRLREKLKIYLSQSSSPQWEKAISSIRVDMEFIENAFRANGCELPTCKNKMESK